MSMSSEYHCKNDCNIKCSGDVCTIADNNDTSMEICKMNTLCSDINIYCDGDITCKCDINGENNIRMNISLHCGFNNNCYSNNNDSCHIIYNNTDNSSELNDISNEDDYYIILHLNYFELMMIFAVAVCVAGMGMICACSILMYLIKRNEKLLSGTNTTDERQSTNKGKTPKTPKTPKTSKKCNKNKFKPKRFNTTVGQHMILNSTESSEKSSDKSSDKSSIKSCNTPSYNDKNIKIFTPPINDINQTIINIDDLNVNSVKNYIGFG